MLSPDERCAMEDNPMIQQAHIPAEAGAQRPEKPKNGTHYRWRDAWGLAFYRPSYATYYDLLHDPQANGERALNWLFFSGIGMTLLMLGRWFVTGILEFTPLIIGYAAASSILMLAATLMVNRLLVMVLRRMGGSGKRDPQLYATALILAPMLLIQGILFQLPAGAYLGIAHLLLWGYALGCWVSALNALHDLPYDRIVIAIAISLALPIAILALIF